MKTILKNSFCLIILLLAANFTSYGQEYIKLERSKTIELSKESRQNMFTFKVDPMYNYLRIKTECELTRGNIMIELVDPSGRLQRNFSIEGGIVKNADNIRTDRMGTVAGQMQKAFRNPTEGDWIVRISPGEASVSLRVYCIMIFNPRTDLLELEQIEKDTDEHIR